MKRLLLTLAFTLLPCAASAQAVGNGANVLSQPDIVQAKSNYMNNPANPYVVTLANNPQAGDLLVSILREGTTPGSVTNWTNAGTTGVLSVWFRSATGGGAAADTFSATTTGTGSNLANTVMEVSGGLKTIYGYAGQSGGISGGFGVLVPSITAIVPSLVFIACDVPTAQFSLPMGFPQMLVGADIGGQGTNITFKYIFQTIGSAENWGSCPYASSSTTATSIIFGVD